MSAEGHIARKFLYLLKINSRKKNQWCQKEDGPKDQNKSNLFLPRQLSRKQERLEAHPHHMKIRLKIVVNPRPAATNLHLKISNKEIANGSKINEVQ